MDPYEPQWHDRTPVPLDVVRLRDVLWRELADMDGAELTCGNGGAWLYEPDVTDLAERLVERGLRCGPEAEG